MNKRIKEHLMDKTGWKTHCFGRYLVDLPPDARINAKYKLWNAEIVLLKGHDFGTLKEDIDKRETELKGQRHRKEPSMWIRRTSVTKHSETLVSWNSASSTLIKTLETYIKRGNSTFRYSPEADATKEEGALRDLGKVLDSLHPRTDNEIPTETGFCIEGGYIAGSEWMDEEFSVSVGFPKYPDVQFGILTYAVGKPGKPLLERVGGTMNDLLGKFAGLKLLRRGKHPVGSIDADEIATAGSENGQRLYAFRWDFPGESKSLAKQRLAVDMSVLEQTPPPPTPPFKDDDEALELWDAIVDSIRLRPGAV